MPATMKNDDESSLCPPCFPRTRKEHCSFSGGRKSPFPQSPGNDIRWHQYNLGLGHDMAPGPAPTATAKMKQDSWQSQSNKKKFLWFLSYNCSSPIQCYLKFISRVVLAHQWQKKYFSVGISRRGEKGEGKEDKMSVCKLSTRAAYHTLIKCILQIQGVNPPRTQQLVTAKESLWYCIECCHRNEFMLYFDC